MKLILASLGAATLATVLSVTVAAQDATKSVNDGVYTADQATRGQKTFEGNCTVCHDIDRFRGAGFVDSWKNEPVFSLFETMSGTMPADNPGGLKPQEYADIIAYFLKLNGFPAGTTELASTKDALSVIKIEPAKSH